MQKRVLAMSELLAENRTLFVADKSSIKAICWELGGLQRHVSSIKDLDKICARLKLPNQFAMLGSDTFYQSNRPVLDMISDCVGRTIAESGVNTNDVDLIIFASSYLSGLPSSITSSTDIAKMLSKNGLKRALPFSISLHQCASGLAALDIACNYIKCGKARNVIIVVSEILSEENERVQPHALYSDAVVSLLVTREQDGIEVVNYKNELDILGWNNEGTFETRKKVVSSSFQSVLDQQEISIKDVKQIFSTNFFRPITNHYANMVGIEERKIYSKCSTAHGHCGGCDPFINFHQAFGEGILAQGDYVIFQSYASAFAANMLLKA